MLAGAAPGKERVFGAKIDLPRYWRSQADVPALLGNVCFETSSGHYPSATRCRL